MATSATLDTHRMVKRLRDAGASEELAEAMADAIRETRDLDLSQLATKADLELLEQRMTIKLGGMIAGAVVLVTAAVKLL